MINGVISFFLVRMRFWVRIALFLGVPAAILVFWLAPEAVSGDELAVVACVPILFTYIAARLFETVVGPVQERRARELQNQFGWLATPLAYGALMVIAATLMPITWLAYRLLDIRWAADSAFVVALILFSAGFLLTLLCKVAAKRLKTWNDIPLTDTNRFARPIFVALTFAAGALR